MTHSKPAVGMPLPLISLPKLGGGTIDIGGARGRHMLLVVYRGKHCGRCKKYLTSLDGMAGDWEAAGFGIVTVSADPLSPQETDRRFAEPAVFCVRPDGIIQIACLSNGPAARPDLVELLDGMKFNIAHDRPARGMA